MISLSLAQSSPASTADHQMTLVCVQPMRISHPCCCTPMHPCSSSNSLLTLSPPSQKSRRFMQSSSSPSNPLNLKRAISDQSLTSNNGRNIPLALSLLRMLSSQVLLLLHWTFRRQVLLLNLCLAHLYIRARPTLIRPGGKCTSPLPKLSIRPIPPWLSLVHSQHHLQLPSSLPLR